MLSLLLLPSAMSGRMLESASCQCMTAFPAGVDPANGVSIGGISYPYPSSYGLSTCAQHDDNLPPACDLPAAGATAKPAWCADTWCYVDKTACNLPTTASSYFPGTALHYSYGTCGSTNTFVSWYGEERGSGDFASGASPPPMAPAPSTGEIVTVIHNYLISLSSTLENNEPEMRSMTSCSTTPPSSCPCSGCRDNTAQALFWTNTSYTLANWNASGTETSRPLSYDFSTVSLTARGDANSADGMMETCLAGFLENAFLRVAAREASIDDRIGFEYAAFQSLGNYVQWPALQWCPSDYDPRFRSWYVSAASGPKDLLIVLDVSGSMRSNGRMGLQIAAAKKLLGTLTSADYIGMVAFSSSASKALSNTKLVQADEAVIARFTTWLDGLSASGGTNFVAAMDAAFEMLTASNNQAGSTSGCTKAILFLSDGVADRWNGDDHASVTRRSTELGGVRIFTYGLGAGMDPVALKSIACRNSGAFWKVEDNGNLGNAMSNYYTFLAPLQATCQVRWTNYSDWSSGAPLTAACIPTFKKERKGDPTSCAEGARGCVPELLGVTCMDVSLIATWETLTAQPDAASFLARVESDRTACNPYSADGEQLQALRARVDAQFGNAVCTAEDLGTSSAPAAVSCSGNTGNGTSTGAPSSQTQGNGAVGAAVAGGLGGVALVVLIIWWASCVGKKKNVQARPSGATGGIGGRGGINEQGGLPMAQPVAQPMGMQMQPPVNQVAQAVAVPVGGYSRQPPVVFGTAVA